jgi:SAM-dependent methyltransferase
MSAPPVEIYGRGLVAATRESPAASYRAVGDDGTHRLLPFRRWLGQPRIEEIELLRRAEPPVLDVGCGPGRHLAALARLAVPGLGLDIAPHAVALARARGCRVLRRSVFQPIPDAGRWRTGLLLDGNLGIEGDPVRLLRRVAELLRPGGSVLAEFEPPQARSREVRLRIEGSHEVSDWFPWAWVSVDDVDSLSAATGYERAEVWAAGGRWFAQLHVPG